MKLSCVRLLVTRFDDCFHFYRDTMGLKVKWGEAGGDYASFDLGEGAYLSIFKRELMARDVRTLHLPSKAVAQDTSLLCLQLDDLAPMYRHLSERGAEFINPPTAYPDYGIKAMHLRDPEGNLIEINSPMPQDQWSEELREEGEKYGWK